MAYNGSTRHCHYFVIFAQTFKNVAPYFVKSAHSITQSLNHSLTQSLTHSGHPLNFRRFGQRGGNELQRVYTPLPLLCQICTLNHSITDARTNADHRRRIYILCGCGPRTATRPPSYRYRAKANRHSPRNATPSRPPPTHTGYAHRISDPFGAHPQHAEMRAAALCLYVRHPPTIPHGSRHRHRTAANVGNYAATSRHRHRRHHPPVPSVCPALSACAPGGHPPCVTRRGTGTRRPARSLLGVALRNSTR